MANRQSLSRDGYLYAPGSRRKGILKSVRSPRKLPLSTSKTTTQHQSSQHRSRRRKRLTRPILPIQQRWAELWQETHDKLDEPLHTKGRAPHKAASPSQGTPGAANNDGEEKPPISPRQQGDLHEDQRASGNDDGKDGDDSGDGGPSKRTKAPTKGLACPYEKRNPPFPRAHGSCLSPFANVTKVKTHILRKHCSTETSQCFRCSAVFDTRHFLKSHQRSDVICQRQQLMRVSVTQHQKHRIQTEVVGESDADSWAQIYTILFPEEQVVPSPYSANSLIATHRDQLSGGRAKDSHLGTGDPGGRESNAFQTCASPESEQEHDLSELSESSSDVSCQFHNVNPTRKLPIGMRGAQPISQLSSAKLLQIEKHLWETTEFKQRTALVNKISKFVYDWLLSLPDGYAVRSKAVTEHPSGSTASGQHDHISDSSNSQSVLEQPLQNLNRNSHKRKAPTDGNGDGDDGDTDEDDEPGQGPGAVRGSKKECRKFACPFVKMFPWLYSQKKRCQGGWPDVNRLKEHLYRQHIINEMCNRCGGAFDGVDELISHQRSDTPCQVQERQAGDGIDPCQLKQLKKKKRIVGSEYDKCRRIYTILWPEMTEGNFPCPYWDPPLLISSNEPSASDYSTFLIREFRPMMLETLETDIVAGNTPSAARVIDMMEGMLPALHERFRYQFNQGFMTQTDRRRRPLGAGSIPRAENAEQVSFPVGATSTGNGSLRANDSPFQADNLGLSTGPTNRSSGLTPRTLGFDMDFTISQHIDSQVLYPNFHLDLEEFLRETVQSA